MPWDGGDDKSLSTCKCQRGVRRFPQEPSPDRHVTTMTIDDALHFSEDERATIVASYPKHELEARTKGVPTLGSGRIFPVPEEAILCEQRTFPEHWARIGGMDFGWDHPFAAVDAGRGRHCPCRAITAPRASTWCRRQLAHLRQRREEHCPAPCV